MSSPSYEEMVADLTGEGSPFEIAEETIGGRKQKIWKNRERSLREKVANAGARGDVDFLIQGDRRFSYGDFMRGVWGTGRALQHTHGLEKGDRLAILSYNCPDWIIALFGATSAGAIGVGLNGWWATEEIEYGLTDSGSRYLVVDERLYPRVEPLLGRIDTLEKVFFIGDSPPAGSLPIDELLTPADEPPTTPIDETDPFFILYTSGTTGRAKGCITTHGGTIAQVTGIVFANVVGAALSGRGLIGGGGGQPAALLTSPLFHVGGLHSNICTQMTAGAKVVFSEGRFDAEQVMALIQEEKIGSWGAIPTMLHRLVHHEKVSDYDLSSLKSISFGGAPTAPETIDKAREVLPIEPSFANAYGLTETHGVATVNGGKDLLGRKTSAGRPLPILELKIVDEDGKQQPKGQLGEVLMYGPTITPGYWNRPEATAETVREGWLYSGDLGYVDEEGFLFIVDRAKDMILRGGENVYCTEIENCLADHPEIDEALSENAVRSHVAGHMAGFKVPEFVEFVADPLPRNAAGKLLKNALRGDGTVPFDTKNLG
jgi:long-chain acyl-CoA synthetase